MHTVYATTSALAAILGQPTGQDERLATALVMASRYADKVVGYNIGSRVAGDDPELPIDSTPVSYPLTVTPVEVPIGAQQATLIYAGRFMRSPDIPFGAAGGLGDFAVRVFADVPEAEMHLLGLRESWGVA